MRSPGWAGVTGWRRGGGAGGVLGAPRTCRALNPVETLRHLRPVREAKRTPPASAPRRHLVAPAQPRMPCKPRSYPRGNPSTCIAMIPFMISDVPDAMLAARAPRYARWSSSASRLVVGVS